LRGLADCSRASGLIEPDDVHEMLAGENSGFSLDTGERIAGPDEAGRA
jgi:hypothetical protein